MSPRVSIDSMSRSNIQLDINNKLLWCFKTKKAKIKLYDIFTGISAQWLPNNLLNIWVIQQLEIYMHWLRNFRSYEEPSYRLLKRNPGPYGQHQPRALSM